MSQRRSRTLLLGAVATALLVAATVVTACSKEASGNQRAKLVGTASRTVSTPPPTAPTTSAPAPAPAPPPVPAAAPVQAVVAAAEKAKPPAMNLGVAVLDLTTGELAEGAAGRKQFYSASLSKLLLAVDMLDRNHAAGLSQSDLRLVNRALSLSDDNAMNALWVTYGGPSAMTRVATGLGLSGTRTPATSSQWGDTTVTAADFTRVYQHILREMKPEDAQVVVGALAGAQQSAADGFNQFFGLLKHGASAERYAKQGWMTRSGSKYLHSVGVLHDPKSGHDYAISLLSLQPSSVGRQTAHDRISAVADAAVATVTTP